MASMIPETLGGLGNVTTGESRLFRLLKINLPDSVFVWYDPRIDGRHPDFVVLDPALGILVLEVKDWKIDTIREVSPTRVVLEINGKPKKTRHPLAQVRDYANRLVTLLEGDPSLCHTTGDNQGRLCFPYGYGVVWTNIRRGDYEALFGGLFVAEGMLFREDIAGFRSAETIRAGLSGLFPVKFPCEITPNRIDRLRWHLFPEVRLPRRRAFPTKTTEKSERGLFDAEKPNADALLAVLDHEQERLAKSLGEGHRLIRGVAGSGKTWTLVCRARFLAQVNPEWRVLVTCFNTTLAAYLGQVLDAGRGSRIFVRTFHSLLGELSRRAGLTDPIPFSDENTVTETAQILGGKIESGVWTPDRFDAVLIDEAHDFPSEWLRLVIRLLDPRTDSLFVVYDGAQNIYKRGFSFAKVGMKVRGRTRLLRTNYRNTREIAEFGTEFLGRGVNYESSDSLRDDEGQLVEIIRPEFTSRSGPYPLLVQAGSFREECAETAAHVKMWLERDGIAPQDILVLYVKRGSKPGDGRYVAALLDAMDEAGIAVDWIARDWKSKRAFRIDEPTVKVSTIHSAKGLDFRAVAMVGVSLLPAGDPQQERKLVYIGLTRARERLLVTWCKESEFVRDMLSIAEERKFNE